MSLEQDREQKVYSEAREAASLLENETLNRIFSDLDSAVVRQWRAEPDPVTREILFYRQQAISWFKSRLLDALNQAAAQDAGKRIEDSFWRRLWKKHTKTE